MTTTDDASVDPGTILVGVDGSRASCLALEWARQQARAEDRSLTVVHAVHAGTPVWQEPNAPDPATAHRLALVAKGEELLAQVRASAGPEDPALTVHEVVRVGDPREVLLELSSDAALLVVGSRGRGPIRSLLLGSTSVALVRQVACPVVVHRPVSDASARHGIAVGVDATTESLTVLDFAFRQAKLRDQPLTVVHAQHFPVSTAPNDPYDEPPWAEDAQGMSMTDRIEKLCEQHPEVTVKTVIHHGMPQHMLIDLAEHVALLVVGIHHRGRAAELTFGSMAVWLVEHAECPVAAVPLSTAL